MEVVLLEDVKTLGKKGQIVKVNDGYARNYILPKKLGVEATPRNLNDLKLQKANAERIAAEQLAAAKELAARIGVLPEEWCLPCLGGGALLEQLGEPSLVQDLSETSLCR